MDELNQELKKGCEIKLNKMIEDGEKALEKLCSSGVSAQALGKMIGNDRTDTLRALIVRIMARSAEAQLLERWNDQQELEI